MQTINHKHLNHVSMERLQNGYAVDISMAQSGSSYGSSTGKKHFPTLKQALAFIIAHDQEEQAARMIVEGELKEKQAREEQERLQEEASRPLGWASVDS